MNYKQFENKIKSMTAHDIIMAMVEGLRKPRTEIDMRTYGEIKGGICYGCAATNAILHIVDANEKEVEAHSKFRSTQFRSTHDDYTLYDFEYAIDLLRCGMLGTYNEFVKFHGFPHITPIPGQELPFLDNNYTDEQLEEYVKLAEYQLTAKTN